jgi:hypothetical protein
MAAAAAVDLHFPDMRLMAAGADVDGRHVRKTSDIGLAVILISDFRIGAEQRRAGREVVHVQEVQVGSGVSSGRPAIALFTLAVDSRP